VTDNNFDYEDRAFDELTEQQEKEAQIEEGRMRVIAQNGNNGEHYGEIDSDKG